MERATNALRGQGQPFDTSRFQYLSPLGWEHINLTGDYVWRSSAKVGAGQVQVAAPASRDFSGLACFKFRFLQRPHYEGLLFHGHTFEVMAEALQVGSQFGT